MADENHEDHDHHPHGSAEERSTAPQSEYTPKQIAFGAVVAVIGVAITFGVPLMTLF